MFHRANTLLAQSSQAGVPQWAAGYLVVVTPRGGRVASAGSGVNTITLDAGHGFSVGDKFLQNPGSSDIFSEAVTSVAETSITISTSTYTVAVGDLLVNLGPDTSSGSVPNYNASPMRVFTDPDGGTEITNAILAASSLGNYDYYYRGDGSCWELILDSASAPSTVITGFGGDERLNVADFGAKGDGTTNDVKAFSAAVRAAGGAGGGTVFVPAGTFIIGPTQTGTDGYGIRVSADNVRVIGAGREVSILKGLSGAYGALDILQFWKTDYCEVRDLSFDGNSDSWRNGLRGYGIRYATWHHLFAKDCDHHGFAVRAHADRGSTECLLDDCIADACDETGIIVWSANATYPGIKNSYIRIANCISKNAGVFHGFEIRYSDYCTLVNCQAFGNTVGGFQIEESSYHTVMSDCVAYNNTEDGLRLMGNVTSVDYSLIDGCHFYNNGESGIYLQVASDNRISNCVIRDNGERGVFENLASAVSSGNSLVNCTVENNNGAGVYIYSTDFEITGGRITNNGSSDGTEVKGIWGLDDPSGIRIVGTYLSGNVNDVTDSASADVYVGTTPLTQDHIIDTPTPGFSYVTPRKSRFPGWHSAVHLPHAAPPNQTTLLVTDNSSFNADGIVLKADTQYDRLFDLPLEGLFDSGANDDIGAATVVHVAARIRAITEDLNVRWSDGTDFTNPDDTTISTAENWRWISKDITLTSLSATFVHGLRLQGLPSTGHILLDGVMITLS